MSSATKRKHVTREVLHDYTLPEGPQQIVKVTASRGNNLHEVQTAHGILFLVSMPTRFRKNVWIKRGDFVIVDPIEEGDKVKGEICIILYPKQIKHIQKEGLWPDQFANNSSNAVSQRPEDRDASIVDKLTEPMVDMVIEERKPKEENDDSEDEEEEEEDDDDEEEEEEEDDDDLFVNTNRPSVTYYYTDSDEDDTDGER